MTSPTNIADGCAAPDQSAPLPAGVDLNRDTVLTGVVANTEGERVGGVYVRLLDPTGEFTAEVMSSPEGAFRFFAAPGSWTLRVLSRSGNGEAVVDATVGLNEVRLSVSSA
jgi:hypothetical protein